MQTQAVRISTGSPCLLPRLDVSAGSRQLLEHGLSNFMGVDHRRLAPASRWAVLIDRRRSLLPGQQLAWHSQDGSLRTTFAS